MKVSMKSKKKLLHVLRWRDHEVSMKESKLITTYGWIVQLTEEDFGLFVDIVVAARASIKSDPNATCAITAKQMNDF